MKKTNKILILTKNRIFIMITNSLESSFVLPCGAVLPNRICKSAMSENMADKNHAPSEKLIKLYEVWAKSGAGLLVTGNVMISPLALGEPHNVVVEDEKHLPLLKRWADAAQSQGAKLWMQINHPGRQAPATINKEVVAPSAIGLKKMSFAFKTPRALEDKEIWEIIEKYGNTALIAKKAGFSGVQIHGAHGYLVSQFLSPLTNVRTDQWGGSIESRAKFVIKIYRNMRKKVGPDFPIGIKINSADFQRGGFSEEESMQVLDILSAEGMDLLEISGGTYEKAAMMGAAAKESTRSREAYFLEYIVKARKKAKAPLMLTGGFRTQQAMEEAVANGEVDIVGLGRGFAVYPFLAKEMFSGKRNYFPIYPVKTGINMIDKMGFLDITWYTLQLERMGEGKMPKENLNAFRALGKMIASMRK